jgi:hypothetical protein
MEAAMKLTFRLYRRGRQYYIENNETGQQASLGTTDKVSASLALIVRSGEGLLRRTRNLCLSSLIEAVRDQTRIVDLKQVNRVLIQPHWRKDCDQPLP